VLDSSFGSAGLTWSSPGTGYGIALDSKERVYLAGMGWDAAGIASGRVCRFVPSGQPDTDFDGDGIAVLPLPAGSNGSNAWAICIDASGYLIVAGAVFRNGGDQEFAVWRLTENGSPDSTFGDQGIATIADPAGDDSAHAVAIDEVGRIVAAGWLATGRDMILCRFLPDGRLDPTFGTEGLVVYDGGSGDDLAFALKMDASGSIYVAGYVSLTEGTRALAVWRYLENGSPDPSFGGGMVHYLRPGGGGRDEAWALTIDPSGRILVAGFSYGALTMMDLLLVRFNPDGTLDSTLGGSGAVTHVYDETLPAVDENAVGISVDSTGRILVCGSLGSMCSPHHLPTSSVLALWRFEADGRRDVSFGRGGIAMLHEDSAVFRMGSSPFEEVPGSMIADSSGRLLVGGYTVDESQVVMAVWRFR